MLFVTHSIAEAVFLSNRDLVMSPRPGRILEDITIDLGPDRTDAIRDSVKFMEYTSRIRSIIGRTGAP